MEFLDHLLLGAQVVLTGHNLLYCIAGILLGTLIGVLPGLGPTATISVLLPATYAIGPIPSIMMLAGIYYGSQYGGSTTAILLNTPGESSAVMTCVDGNRMTKKGQAGPAIFAAGMSSFIAGIIATILIAVFSPPLSELALVFGAAEYCALMLLGFLTVGILTTGDMVKGIGMACIGILLGMVGTDISTGVIRFSMDVPELMDGITFPIYAVGLFAFAEIIKNICATENIRLYRGEIRLLPTWDQFKRIIPSSLRGSAVGSFFGLIPGGSAAISSFAAYAIDKKYSRHRDEIGQGAIEGVAAPESANNAASQTGFIPLLSLGLPENATMALMLGALLLSGVQPGPGIVDRQPELFWGLIVSMIVGNFILFVLNVPFIKIWTTLLRVPYHLLYPIIVAVCFIGIYSIHNNANDLIIVAMLGLAGYFFIVYNMEVAPLMLGLILGPMFEENFRRQMVISKGDLMVFIDRPLSLSILLITVGLMSFGLWKIIKNK
jgi:putative tricarboxylic transport membrane protein